VILCVFVCLIVCLFFNSSKKTASIEIKFSGNISLGVQKILGCRTYPSLQPFAKKLGGNLYLKVSYIKYFSIPNEVIASAAHW